MTGAKHTPGPWVYEALSDEVISLSAGTVCRPPNIADEDEQAQWRTDAAALAAVPELIDALAPWAEDPCACFADPPSEAGRADCECVMCERTRMARSALAKARGES